MPNYLAQIATRNFSSEQPMLRPERLTFTVGLGEDPFERTDHVDVERESAAKETPRLSQEIITTERKSPRQAQTETGEMKGANPAAQPRNIKSPYLSKYIERSQYIYKEPAREWKEADQGAGLESKISETSFPELFLAEKKSLTENRIKTEVPAQEPIHPVSQPAMHRNEHTPKVKAIASKKQATREELKPVPLPAATNRAQKDPPLIQPNLPVPGSGQVQKEKPAPSLVIGKITVEVLPAQKPVTKIINQAVKPRPVTNQPSKFSFGLGQL